MVRKIRCCVFVWFTSLRKYGQYVFKAVRINCPKCSFVRVARWYDFTNFIPKNKNAQQYDMLQYSNVSSIGLFSPGHIPSGTCRQNSCVEWHWLKFLEPDLFAFRSVQFAQQTSVWRTVGGLDTEYINVEWIYMKWKTSCLFL